MRTHYRPHAGPTWTVDVFTPQRDRWLIGVGLEVETHPGEQTVIITLGVADVHVHRMRRRRPRGGQIR